MELQKKIFNIAPQAVPVVATPFIPVIPPLPHPSMQYMSTLLTHLVQANYTLKKEL